MLQKTKKIVINTLVKLKIIEKKTDKNKNDLPQMPYILGPAITITLIQTIFNFRNDRFFSLKTLYSIILFMIFLYPVIFVLKVINKMIGQIKKYTDKF